MKEHTRKIYGWLAHAAPFIGMLAFLVMDWLYWSIDSFAFQIPIDLFCKPLLGAVVLSSYVFLVIARAEWLHYAWITFVWGCPFYFFIMIERGPRFF